MMDTKENWTNLNSEAKLFLSLLKFYCIVDSFFWYITDLTWVFPEEAGKMAVPSRVYSLGGVDSQTRCDNFEQWTW
jgi:hypothetical protein